MRAMRLVHAFAVIAGAAGLAALAPAQSAPSLTARVAALRELAPAARVVELRAIADALLFRDDQQERAAVVAALRTAAGTGAFYSPSRTEPSFLWFEFERALRRADVRAAGRGPAELERTLQQLLARRKLVPLGILGGAPPRVHDLTSFGWHGSGEVLEAVADLAEGQGTAASAVGAELAEYLDCEKPHPLTPHPEGAAGLAEQPTLEVEARHFPVMWSDGYRIALARAVLATRPPGVDLSQATLHLLYSPRRADRLAAIEHLREGPLTAAAVEHLIAQLGDGDRLVVREAVVTLGGGGDAAREAVDALRKVATGDDKELRTVAERAIARLTAR
jgi:hypothetical protein